MDWPDLSKKIALKLEHLCISDERTKFKREDDVMKRIWAEENALKLMSLWLSDCYKKRARKSSEIALKLKQTGNSELQKRNYSRSIDLYTRSAIYAPKDSDLLSIAISNRSVCLFYSHRYHDCIQDIQWVTTLGCQDTILCKLYLRKIQCYLKLGKHELANEALKKAEVFIETCNIAVSDKGKHKKRLEELKEILHNDVGHEQDSVAKVVDTTRQRSVLPNVVFGKHPDFPSASMGIDIRHSPKKGNHVVANRFIKKGEVLFVEKPIAFANLKSAHSYNLCHNCLQTNSDIPFPCTDCLNALYCSVECFTEASLYHCWECVGHQSNLWEKVGITHTAMNVLFNSANTTDKILFNKVQELVTNFDTLPVGDLIHYGTTAAMLTLYLTNFTNFFQTNNIKTCFAEKFTDESLNFSCGIDTSREKQIYVSSFILRYILQLICNAYSITKLIPANEIAGNLGAEINTVASGLYLSASIMNHSCKPNIIYNFQNEHIVIRAAENIAMEDELFNCYGPCYRFMTRENRQIVLKQQYGFTCECEACTLPEFRYFVERFTALKCPECTGALCDNNNFRICVHCGNTLSECNEVKIEVAKRIITSVETSRDSPLFNIKEAIYQLQKCLRIRKSVLYKDHEDITNTHDLIAQLYFEIGRYSDSILHREYVVSANMKQFGFFNLDVYKNLLNLYDAYTAYLQMETCSTTSLYKDIKEKSLSCKKQIMELQIWLDLADEERCAPEVEIES